MKKIVLLFFFSILFTNSKAQIPNSDFESWDVIIFGFYEVPTDWWTNNDKFIQTITRDADSYHGQYSLRIENLMLNGIRPYADAYFKLFQHPTFLSAYVKANSNSSDTASIKITLFNNTVLVDSGVWSSTAIISNWVNVKIPVTQSSTIVDSATIEMTGGIHGDSAYFWVDNLSLDYGNYILEQSEYNISIFPNPFTSSSTLQFNTQLNNAQLIIYDILGKEMMRKSFSGDKMEIERGNLESRVYFVKVNDGERQWVQKIMVE